MKLDVSDIFLGQVQRWDRDFVPIRFTGRSRNDTGKVRLTIGYKFGKAINNNRRNNADTNKEERGRLGIQKPQLKSHCNYSNHQKPQQLS
ncbi:hypothetical protein [Sphingobacterium thalpophilum]|uniref:hypothetical protein n=1 Tax=Sphingobacterium thalpophilum TaxID=259 RepID=UPI0024A6ABF8|nr:hypothetical protein [Sphingobacterium thalpophilum]